MRMTPVTLISKHMSNSNRQPPHHEYPPTLEKEELCSPQSRNSAPSNLATMSNPNSQPNDLKGMVRTKRRSNNRHTTFSQRERPPPARYHDLGPWTVTPSTNPLVPQNRPFQPFPPEAANNNPAGAPPTGPLQLPANQPATPTNATLPIFGQTQPSTNNPSTPTTANATLPIFTQPNPPNNPSPPTTTTSEPTPQQPQQPPPPKPHLHPSSPTASITSQNLEDIDLRSPSDDPDYDFIETAEATHSARNAQPDRADKYPELRKGSKVAPSPKQGDVAEGGESETKVEAKKGKKGRGWFSFL